MSRPASIAPSATPASAPPTTPHGRVSYFPGRAAACYGCTLSRRKRTELLTFWDATVRPCAAPPGAAPNPSRPPWPPSIGALAGRHRLASFLENSSAALGHRAHSRPRPAPRVFPPAPQPACPFHAPAAPPLLPAGDRRRSGAPVRSRLRRPSRLEPAASIGPSASTPACRACLHRGAPFLRSAKFRRHGVCPSCASRDILEWRSSGPLAPQRHGAI